MFAMTIKYTDGTISISEFSDLLDAQHAEDMKHITYGTNFDKFIEFITIDRI